MIKINYEKLIIVLLLITIILSITSMILTFSMNIKELPKINPKNLVDVNSGNIEFSISATSKNLNNQNEVNLK